MHPKYPNLFSPIKIGSLIFKNRIMSPPNSLPSVTVDGHLGPDEIAFFELKAKGGAASVTLGESIVDTQTGKSHNRQILLDDPNVIPTLANAAKAIKRQNCIASIELSHGGKYAGTRSYGGDYNLENVAYGPSDDVTADGEIIKEMPKEIIYHIVESWGKSAAVAKRAGFDMLMVHAAHGWLFTQFLSPKLNHRTDEFGGSLENRARFLLLSLDAIRAAVGPAFPIELRINGDDFIDGASTLEDYIEICKMCDDKVDLFNVSCGDHEDTALFCRTHPSMFFERGCNVYLAAEIKKHVKTPIATIGALYDPQMCEDIIASGKADLVEMGRALVADPYLPKKAFYGKEDDITPCIRCMLCISESWRTETIKCAVNPIIGNELDYKLPEDPIEKVKNVLVVGGGPGGMQAAIKASERGHKVTLCEKSSSLGGLLKSAGGASYKTDIIKFMEVMTRRVMNCGCKVLLNTEVTPEFVNEMKPDAIIVTVGAKPIVPRLPGIDSPKVVMAAEAEQHADRLGNRVVILGGGLVGCELAVDLGRRGKKADIVELLDDVAVEANIWHRGSLLDNLKKLGTGIHTKTKGKAVTDKGLLCEDENGNEVLFEADNVVVSVGLRPLTDVADSFVGLAQEVYVIGDCLKPRLISDAMSEGYYVARSL